jgi:putative polyhydroxyalkanoate system protein
MAKISIDVPHELTKDEAKSRIERLAHDWASKYGVRFQWTEDTVQLQGKVMGMSVEAQVRVEPGQVRAEASDPGFLFREKAKKYVHEKLTHYLKA